jgi:UDP-glucose 4-epimerase
LDRARRGEDINIYGDGNQTRDQVFVKDAVEVLFRGFSTDVVGVYNVGSGKEVTINDLAKKVITTVGKDVGIVHKDARKGEIYRSYADISKLNEHLGFSPNTELEKGLKETLEWLDSR